VWVLRTGGGLLLLAGAAVRRPTPPPAPLGAPRRHTGLLVAGIGLLDTLAFVCNNVGTTLGLVSVVSVLGSLFAAVTVLVAWLALGERMARRQWAGVALILGGVALVSG